MRRWIVSKWNPAAILYLRIQMPEGFINILTYPDWRKSRCGRGTQSTFTISTQVGSTNNWFRYQRIWKWTFLKHNTRVSQNGYSIIMLRTPINSRHSGKRYFGLTTLNRFGFLNEFTPGEICEIYPVTWIFGVVRMPATKGSEPFSWETALVIELDELGMASRQGKYKLG